MQTKNNEAKKAIIGIGAFLFYMISALFQTAPLTLLNIDYDSLSTNSKIFYVLSFSITQAIILILLFLPKLKEDFIDLKQNHKEYFSKSLKCWFISLGFMYLSNIILMILNSNNIAENEQIIRNMFDISPLYVYISAVILAPLIEELVFRLGFRYAFKTNWLFIITSGLVFGSLHTITSATNWIDFLYIIPYSFPGLAFAYILTKTNNIFVSMGIHLLHNGILIGLQFVLLFFGTGI